jgi:hypothetical protein
MQDYDTRWTYTELEQAEYDAWQRERDTADQQQQDAAWWMWVDDQARE